MKLKTLLEKQLMKTLWFGVVCVQVPVQIVRRKAFTIGSLPSCEIGVLLGTNLSFMRDNLVFNNVVHG